MISVTNLFFAAVTYSNVLVCRTESKDGTNPKKSQQSSDEDSDDEDEHWLPQSMRLLGIAHECLGR